VHVVAAKLAFVPVGRPRERERRNVCVRVFFTVDEWTDAELIAASRSWYSLPAFLRELMKREIAKPESADLLGDEAREAAAREIERLARKRRQRLEREQARARREARDAKSSKARVPMLAQRDVVRDVVRARTLSGQR